MDADQLCDRMARILLQQDRGGRVPESGHGEAGHPPAVHCL